MSYQGRTGAVLFATDVERMGVFCAGVLGLREASRAGDHILLESPVSVSSRIILPVRACRR